jgi:cytochrome c
MPAPDPLLPEPGGNVPSHEPQPETRTVPMKTDRLQLVLTLAAALAAAPAFATGNATQADATAMVKKGIAFIKSNGKDKGYTEISNKQGSFIDRDLYLVVYGLDGTVRAHGANEKMVGKNLIELKDIDGKPFVKERVELAQSKGTFWQDYKFTNPVTKKIEPKSMYCERLEDAVVCGGIYK